MWLLALAALVCAAYLEITGDVRIGNALAASKVGGVLLGWLLLGAYGIVVNGYNWAAKRVGHGETWEFSRLLGVYIAVFAAMNLLLSPRRTGPHPAVSKYTVLGTAVVICGGVIIQFGADVVGLCRTIVSR